MAEPPLLSVRNLGVAFDTRRGSFDAVRAVSFDVQAGRTLGVVGESGSGKSVTAMAIMGLLPETARITSGEVRFADRTLGGLPEKEMQAIRGRDIAMVFQDPMASLNPILTIGHQLAEPLRLHLGLGRAAARVRAEELLALVRIPSPAAILRAYPPTTYFSVPDGVYYGGRFNLAWAGWYGGTDPEQSEFFTCSQRAPGGPDLTRWCDPWYDRMFLEQSATLDRQVRTATLYKMQRTIRNAGLFVPLVYSGSFSGTNPAVRGWFPNMLYEFSNSEDWDVVPNRTARR